VTALLLDEMLSGAIAEQLRARNLDVVAVVEDPRLVGTPDEELLVHAATQKRVLVTANVADFAAIVTDWRGAGREHAGLVYVTSRAFPQDRSFVGAVVSSLLALHDSGGVPHPGGETFLRRT
jgi:hypothetical protein